MTISMNANMMSGGTIIYFKSSIERRTEKNDVSSFFFAVWTGPDHQRVGAVWCSMKNVF
jgi:hypothetical protein